MKDDESNGPERPITTWRKENTKRFAKLLESENEGSGLDQIAETISSITGREQRRVTEDLKKIINNKTSSFGAKWAVNVENAIKKLISNGDLENVFFEEGMIDKPPSEIRIAYILASIRLPAWGQIYASLSRIPEVKEASLIYGSHEIDAIIKIEASIEHLNDILLKEIASHPHIIHTQTLQAIPDSQWQRKQEPRRPCLEELFPETMTNNLDIDFKNDDLTDETILSEDYLNRIYFPGGPRSRIREFFLTEQLSKLKSLSDLAKGKVKLKRAEDIKYLPDRVLEYAEFRIQAVVIWSELTIHECEKIIRYIKGQKERKNRDPDFLIRRIFVLEDTKELHENEFLQARLGKELDAGIQIRYLEKSQWPEMKLENEPADFGIMDNCLLWTMKNIPNIEGVRITELSLDRNDVETKVLYYNRLWEKARELDPNLMKICSNAKLLFPEKCND
jgi:hypothetical protein